MLGLTCPILYNCNETKANWTDSPSETVFFGNARWSVTTWNKMVAKTGFIHTLRMMTLLFVLTYSKSGLSVVDRQASILPTNAEDRYVFRIYWWVLSDVQSAVTKEKWLNDQLLSIIYESMWYCPKLLKNGNIYLNLIR